MEYKNDKIKQLLAERNAIIEKYNLEIKNEIAKEKAKYKFNWKLFLLTIVGGFFFPIAIEVNKKILPKTSIWSWEYYAK